MQYLQGRVLGVPSRLLGKLRFIYFLPVSVSLSLSQLNPHSLLDCWLQPTLAHAQKSTYIIVLYGTLYCITKLY